MFKSNKGFTGIDIVLSIIIVITFTSIIVSLMYSVKMENYRIKAMAISNIYLVETLENIGIANYDEIKSDNTDLFPKEMSTEFEKKIEVTSISDEDTSKEDIIKKVKVTIAYADGRTYKEKEITVTLAKKSDISK